MVAKVFLDLWFTEQSEETPDGLIKRVVSITEAVAESPDQNCDWFKLLLNQYLKPGDEVSASYNVLFPLLTYDRTNVRNFQ